MKRTFAIQCVAGLLLLLSAAAFADSAWVTDQFEVTLRSGPSTTNSITKMLKSGGELEVLERDADSGYTRVRAPDGKEGWILTRYLMNEPSARDQLNRLTGQLTNASQHGSSLTEQLNAINAQYSDAKRQITTLEASKKKLEGELADIKQTASNTLAINSQNKDLREKVAASEIKVGTLAQSNREISSQTTRYWFMTGALVLIVGIVLGLILPRIRWQRRSRYDRF